MYNPFVLTPLYMFGRPRKSVCRLCGGTDRWGGQIHGFEYICKMRLSMMTTQSIDRQLRARTLFLEPAPLFAKPISNRAHAACCMHAARRQWYRLFGALKFSALQCACCETEWQERELRQSHTHTSENLISVCVCVATTSVYGVGWDYVSRRRPASDAEMHQMRAL